MGKYKDGRDIFYRKAKELGFRARSAFKLLQVDEECDVFSGVRRAVDLCAAPGSWSQVLNRRLNDPSLRTEGDDAPAVIVAVDLQEMALVPGVDIVQGDITSQETADLLIAPFRGQRAQLVVCDGAPDVTGIHDMDEYLQAQLLLAALNITTFVLERGGSFVAKMFKGAFYPLLHDQLSLFFTSVRCVKPESSRARSAEHFVVCKNFAPPPGYVPALFSAIPQDQLCLAGGLQEREKQGEEDTRQVEVDAVNRAVMSFMACGDLSPCDNGVGTRPVSSASVYSSFV